MTFAFRCSVACVAVAVANPQEYFFPFLSLTHDGDTIIRTRSKFDRHCENFATSELHRHEGATEDVFVKAASPLCKSDVGSARCTALLKSLWAVDPLQKAASQAVAMTNSSKQHSSTSLAAWCQRLWDDFPRKALASPMASDKAVKILAARHTKLSNAFTKVTPAPIRSHSKAPPKGHVKPQNMPRRHKTAVTTTATTTTAAATAEAPKPTTTQTVFDAAAESALANLVSLGLGNSDAAAQLRKRLLKATPSLRGVVRAQVATTTTVATTTATTTTASTSTSTTRTATKATTSEVPTTTSRPRQMQPVTHEKTKAGQRRIETVQQVFIHTRAQRLAQQAEEMSSPDVDAAMDGLSGALDAADSLSRNA